MNSGTEQNLTKKVIVKIDVEDIPGIKIQLKRLQENTPDLQLKSIRIGRLGDDVVLSFNINERHYDSVMERLETIGAVSILNENSKSKDMKSTASKRPAKGGQPGFYGDTNSPQNDPAVSLDKIISEGDYEKVIQFSRNIKNGFDTMKKAKENIDAAVNKSIQLLYSKALKNKVHLDESIAELIKISTNKELRILNKIDLMKDAGMKAVDLCVGSFENVSDLVTISNNNFIPNIVSITAAVKFSEIIFNNPEKYKEEYQYAIKHLNTRWILIARDIVINKLSENEKALLKKLIDYIDSAR